MTSARSAVSCPVRGAIGPVSSAPLWGVVASRYGVVGFVPACSCCSVPGGVTETGRRPHCCLLCVARPLKHYYYKDCVLSSFVAPGHSFKPGSKLASLATVAACCSCASARGCTAMHSTRRHTAHIIQHSIHHTAQHIAHAQPSKAQTHSTTQSRSTLAQQHTPGAEHATSCIAHSTTRTAQTTQHSTQRHT